MSTPTISQVRQWDPEVLNTQAAEWEQKATTLGDTMDASARAVDSSHHYWVGAGGDTMRDRHDEIHGDARGVRKALEDGATAAHSGATAIQTAKNTLLTQLAAVENAKFVVSDTGEVRIDPSVLTQLAIGNRVANQVTLAGLEAKAAQYQQTIQSALAACGAADDSAEQAVNAAFANLLTTQFTPTGDEAAGLTGEDGKRDAQLVASGQAGNDDLVRIGNKLAGIQPGQVSDEEMDYLSRFYNTLGGQGVLGMSDRLTILSLDPNAVRAETGLANGLYLLSDHDNGTGSHQGGYDKIPTDLQAMIGLGSQTPSYTNPLGSPVANLQNLSDLQRLGNLVDKADPKIKPGTQMGIEMDRVAARLALSVDSGMGVPPSFNAENTMREFLAGGERNTDSSYHVLTGTNADNTLATWNRDTVVMPLLQHQWQDHGTQLGKMFDWIGQDAGSPDLDIATRSARAASGLTEILSAPGNYDSLMQHLGPHHDSTLGAVNPVAAQSISTALAPYAAGLAGVPEVVTGTHGFQSFGPVEAVRVFSLLDTDPTAGGIMNGTAMAQAQLMDKLFAAQDASGLGGNTDLGIYSEHLRWLTQNGLTTEAAVRNLDAAQAAALANQQDAVAWKVKSEIVNGAIAVGATVVPGGKEAALVVTPAAKIMEAILEHRVDTLHNPAIIIPDQTVGPHTNLIQSGTDHERMYSMMQGLIETGSLNPKALPSEYLDGDGKTRPYVDVANDVDTSGNRLNRFGPLEGILTGAGVKDTDLTRYLSQATGAEIHQDPSIHPPGINPSDATKGIMLGTLSPNGNDEWTQ
ncbi:WXG100 family type VII secretion target [Nocardia sp. NBC_00511]|uniref:WXG100 family type VII secretion target n=1 Tax=Nocardia sp. NBC_00511 TaxID=2903591 RepID=UPI0030DE7B2B